MRSLALLLLAGCAAAAPGAAGPVNLLVIIADDMGHDHLSIAGHPVARTPNLDRLARGGVRFTHAFTPNPICTPSRAAILTGQDCFTNDCWFFGRPIRETSVHFARTLRDAGYVTFYTGKWHNDGWPAQRGFVSGGNVIGGGCPVSRGGHPRPRVRDLDGRNARTAETFCTTLTSDTAIRFLRERSAGAPPFLAVASYSSPHDPWDPPRGFAPPQEGIPLPPNFMPRPAFRWFSDWHGTHLRDEALWPFPRTPDGGRDVLSRYFGMVAQMDLEIGRLLDALDAAGLAENTLVLFVADHGISLGAHGFSGKQTMYEEGIRLPLILRHPRLRRGGPTRSELVSLIDLFPTLCEAAGVPVPPGVEGRSLLGLYRGRPAWARDRLHAAFVSPERHRLDSRAVRTESHKYIENLTTGEIELYDLRNDPYELENLAGRPATSALQQALAADLRAWRAGHESGIRD